MNNPIITAINTLAELALKNGITDSTADSREAYTHNKPPDDNLEALSKPLRDYLRKHHNHGEYMIIKRNSITVVDEIVGENF
jgi:hypothetical protein